MIKRTPHIVFTIVLLCSLLFLTLPAGCQLIQKEALPVSEGINLNLYGTDPYSLDPAISGDATSHQYVMQIFSGLVCLDDNLDPAPDIASSWKISNEGKTYTFYLRRDVKFHDGKGVKAQDFKYSWQRACDPTTGSQTAPAYLGDIVGAKQMLAGESKEISGIRVLDDYTLEVTIDIPRSYFLYKMAYPTAYVVDKVDAESGTSWWRNPNGTGPFKLSSWTENSLLVLEKNTHFYGELAKVDSVVFHLWGGVPMDMYEKGEIDVTDVSVYYIDKVTDKAGPFYQELSIVPELSFYYIGFNTTKPPFDDINIRRAFSQAIDKEKIISLIFRDVVQKADGILPPGMPGFNEELSGLAYDIEKARELIKKSRYGSVTNLPPITITTAGWGGLISKELEAIIHQWRENLGVEVRVRQLEPERYIYHLAEEKDEMYDMGWIADYPHPQDFLEILFHSEAENNYGGYSNPEIDALLITAGAEPDEGKSMALYQLVEQKLVSDAACIPLWFGRNYVLVKPYVSGCELNVMGITMLNKVTIKRN